MTIKDFISIIESRIPNSIQESFDNSGIQIGPFDKELRNPLLALDASEEVVEKAIEINSNMIISHHPFFFNPFKSLIIENSKTKLIQLLFKYEITLYACHTPIDKIDGGMNDYFSHLIGLENLEGIIDSGKREIYKVQVFVPKTHKDMIIDKIAEVGGGWIGNYSECTFSSSGIGTFKPHEGTNPYIGRYNKREYANETKIETVIPKEQVDMLIREVEKVHPYEEVAMEAFPLNRPVFHHFLCRKGELSHSMTLVELIEKLKIKSQQKSIRYNGNDNKIVKRVAVCTGSGANFSKHVLNEGIDAFITGDVGYHDFQFAEENGISIIEITHNNTEKYFPSVFMDFFKDTDAKFQSHSFSFLKEF
ncbi:MAG: Nif3-like dinuclear metal center hexameric protein [Thermotogota bacterium]|nr:Nif3-like dinuclear metal center hexameric protein [Thermotogota bacterium]